MGTDKPVSSSSGQDQSDGLWAGPEGPGQPGEFTGQGDGRGRRSWRHHALIAGASVAAAGMVIAGLAATDATAATALTTPQIAAKVDPGLVDVVTTLGYQSGKAAGTGMVLTSTGEVLTNNHVIDGATSIKATDVGNGRTYTAKVVGYDKTHDVAVLQLQNASGLQTVTLSSAGAQSGQKVVALGNALGKGGTPSVVSGRITGLGQSITASDQGAGDSEQLTGMISHNAPIQPGDSGGAAGQHRGGGHRHEHCRFRLFLLRLAVAIQPGTDGDPGVRHPDYPGILDRGPDRGGHAVVHRAHRRYRVPRRGDLTLRHRQLWR